MAFFEDPDGNTLALLERRAVAPDNEPASTGRVVTLPADASSSQSAMSAARTSSSVVNGNIAAPERGAPVGQRVLGEHDVSEQRCLAIARAVADENGGLPAVLRVLDRRLLADAAR